MQYSGFSLSGAIRSSISIQKDTINLAAGRSPTPKIVGHSILIVDRSGSMYGSITDLKRTIRELCVVQSVVSPETRVSLISYSSSGDVQLHFEAIPVSEIADASSPSAKAIDSIRSTGCTCISQALRLAADVARRNLNMTTCVTLHSDGYANDPSAYTESKEISKAVEAILAVSPSCFVNTVAYSDYSDFRMLQEVAKEGSGTAILAKTAKDVFEALQASVSSVGSKLVTFTANLSPYQTGLVVSSVDGKSVAVTHDQPEVRGLSPDAVIDVYTFSPSAFSPSHLVVTPDQELEVAAYCRFLLLTNSVQKAKSFILTLANPTLIPSLRAITPHALAEFGSILDNILYGRNPFTTRLSREQVFQDFKVTVVDVARALANCGSSILVNPDSPRFQYKRQTVEKVAGVRTASGDIDPPWVKTAKKQGVFPSIQSVDVNSSSANINITLSVPVDIVESKTGTLIPEVAGVSLDRIREYRSYTMIQDGQIRLPGLPICFTDSKSEEAIRKLGVELEALGPDAAGRQWVYLDWSSLPVIHPDQQFPVSGIGKNVELYLQSKVLQKLFNAVCSSPREKDLSPEQAEELKRHFITSGGQYFSPPTTTVYADLQEALVNGTVDTRIQMFTQFGTTSVLNSDHLASFNKTFEKFYELYDPSLGAIHDHKTDWIWSPELKVRRKTLSARSKVSTVEAFVTSIYDSVFGITSTDLIKSVLTGLNVDPAVIQAFVATCNRSFDYSLGQAAFQACSEWVDSASESTLMPLSAVAFYVGSTGFIPWDDVKPIDYDALNAMFPELPVSKSEKEGTFFVLEDSGKKTVVSIYQKPVYFSINKN